MHQNKHKLPELDHRCKILRMRGKSKLLGMGPNKSVHDILTQKIQRCYISYRSCFKDSEKGKHMHSDDFDNSHDTITVAACMGTMPCIRQDVSPDNILT